MRNRFYVVAAALLLDILRIISAEIMVNETGSFDFHKQIINSTETMVISELGLLSPKEEDKQENGFHVDTVVPDTVTVAYGDEVAEIEGVCQIYRGTRCSNYLGNKTVHVPPPQTQRLLEEKLANAFKVIDHSEDLSPNCHAFAEPSLCYSAFPLCHDDDLEGKKQPRRICREDCDILENEMCRMEYAIAKRHPLIGQQLVLPECGDLPLVGSKESEGCLKLGIPRPENVEPSHVCFWDHGESYRGLVKTTSSGNKCTPWSHNFKYKTSDFPELSGGHSFCRNPNGEMEKPWCFVDNKKELCDVPQCVFNLWLYVTSALVVTLLLLISSVAYWCCFRKRKPPSVTISQQLNGPGNKICVLKTSRSSSPSKSTGKGSQVMEMHLLLPAHCSSKGERTTSGVRAREYQLANVKFLQELGEGAFGKVYKGEVNTGEPGEPCLQVAIKTLKENATPKTQADFRREVELMTDLRHSNIVCLLGVIMKGEPLCMLFEYMTEGDLHEFLICHSPRSDVSAYSDEGNNHVLGQAEFLHIALQIANGMEYLSSHHYVHRDLAARNCLVGDNLTVKISDFGLSRDVYSSDYYRVQSKSLLPVRWMPPESILYGKFTTESDVWSYGVVLWEIYSYGLQPYYGYSNQEVIDMIRSRQLLPCPEDCPSGLYGLMIECWHEIPNRRPQFPDISSRLRAWWTNVPNSESDARTPGLSSSSCFNQCQSSSVMLHTGSLPSNYSQQLNSPIYLQNQVLNSQLSNSHHILPVHMQGAKATVMHQRHPVKAKVSSPSSVSQVHNSFGKTVAPQAQLVVRLPPPYKKNSNAVETKISII
ncbi:tyrosine-protein kinase transmembrane receptor Ror isoform X2 [Anabrus simplex]|uniref:tyrosine-protein kinase transmembrane receptor Ror isoform X2 n=1 Tax=Anabrus simplex TaxID=316456 RepID=UPI0035A3D358